MATAIALALAVACQPDNVTQDRSSAPITAPPFFSILSQTVILSPSADTRINVDAVNYSTDQLLTVYTWPNDTIANAILMKFDLSGIPAGSTIESATLNLYLLLSDQTGDALYSVPVHKVVNHNPDLSAATGYTYDGTNAWTANACCSGHVPLAQADIGTAIDTKNVDKTPGFKQWTATSLVQDWLNTPSANFGLLLIRIRPSSLTGIATSPAATTRYPATGRISR